MCHPQHHLHRHQHSQLSLLQPTNQAQTSLGQQPASDKSTSPASHSCSGWLSRVTGGGGYPGYRFFAETTTVAPGSLIHVSHRHWLIQVGCRSRYCGIPYILSAETVASSGEKLKDLTPAKNTLDPIETASRDEISALQLKRMQWSLTHAYNNVPFYRKLFDDAGVVPTDLASLEDISKFPFTVKGNLRDNYPFDMFAVPREQVARIHASSGTTGKPTVVGYTPVSYTHLTLPTKA